MSTTTEREVRMVWRGPISRFLQDEAQLTAVTRESVTRAQAAEMLARVAHRGQKELFGGDYIVHLDRVVALLATDDEKTVGWLHDIIEDCAVSHVELVKWFGPKIADTVCTLSRNPQATYLDYIDSIRDSGNTVAIAVKRADLLDHLRPETFHRLPAELRARYEAALAMFPESAPTPR